MEFMLNEDFLSATESNSSEFLVVLLRAFDKNMVNIKPDFSQFVSMNLKELY